MLARVQVYNVPDGRDTRARPRFCLLFAIAWPFSRVDVVLGAPIEPVEDGALARLQDAIHRANARAHAPSGAPELTCAAS